MSGHVLGGQRDHEVGQERLALVSFPRPVADRHPLKRTPERLCTTLGARGHSGSNHCRSRLSPSSLPERRRSFGRGECGDLQFRRFRPRCVRGCRPTGLVTRFQHHSPGPGSGKMGTCNQTVVAASNSNCVVTIVHVVRSLLVPLASRPCTHETRCLGPSLGTMPFRRTRELFDVRTVLGRHYPACGVPSPEEIKEHSSMAYSTVHLRRSRRPTCPGRADQ